MKEFLTLVMVTCGVGSMVNISLFASELRIIYEYMND